VLANDLINPTHFGKIMTTDTSKVTIHMVSSLDGFIARKDNSVSWFDSQDNYEKGIVGENAEEFIKTIDCFVMGARTYELALTLGWPYDDVPAIVLTHRDLPCDRKSVGFRSGDLDKLVNNQLKPKYKNIWVVGGASLVHDLVSRNLADEIRLSILPIILGDGMLFLDNIGHEQALHLKNVTAFKTGMVELWYEIKK
jgi:dihydrofolate reductase